MSVNTVRRVAIISFFVAMIVLLGGRYCAVERGPAYPDKVVGPDGSVFFTKSDIDEGQEPPVGQEVSRRFSLSAGCTSV